MTLNLNIDKLAGRGRPAKPLSAEVVRELTEADIALLATDRGVTPAPLQRITDRHHSLARLLAAGTPETEAAFIVGYDISRVSILKQSPAFAELLALYRKEVDAEFATILDHMSGLSRDALIELRSRLEDEPDKFSNRELLAITTDLVDRSVENSGGSSAPVRVELVAGGAENAAGEAEDSSHDAASPAATDAKGAE